MAFLLRIKQRDLEGIEEEVTLALKIVGDLKRLVETGFEQSIRSGLLESMFSRLSLHIDQLVSYGFTNLHYARERSALLTRYAHAIQVRLRGKPIGSVSLIREQNDFMSHLNYIEGVLTSVKELVESIPRRATRKTGSLNQS